MHAVPLMLLAAVVTANPSVYAPVNDAASPGQKVLQQPIALKGEEEQQPIDVDPTPYRPLLGWRHKEGDEEALATIPRDDIWRRGQWSVTNMIGASVANLG